MAYLPVSPPGLLSRRVTFPWEGRQLSDQTSRKPRATGTLAVHCQSVCVQEYLQCLMANPQ